MDETAVESAGSAAAPAVEATAEPAPARPKRDVFAIVMTIAALALLVGICALSINASRELAETYHAFAGADLSRDFAAEIVYDDHAGLQAHHGMSLPGGDPDNERLRSEFLADALASIDQMILFVCSFYALLLGLLLAYPLWKRFGSRPGTHVAAIAIAAVGAFAIILGCILITHAACGAPFIFPTGVPLLTLAVGLLCGIGGLSAVGLLLRVIRWKRIAAVLVIPLVFVIAIPVPEEGLLASPTVESFDHAHGYYESVGGADFDGPCYYDDERGVLVIGEREFEPEMVPNPNYYTGAKRVLAIAWEAINPFSGNAITMIIGGDVPEAPVWVLALYAAKALLWIVLPVALARRKQ